jgi:hypothetical protein
MRAPFLERAAHHVRGVGVRRERLGSIRAYPRRFADGLKAVGDAMLMLRGSIRAYSRLFAQIGG